MTPASRAPVSIAGVRLNAAGSRLSAAGGGGGGGGRTNFGGGSGARGGTHNASRSSGGGNGAGTGVAVAVAGVGAAAKAEVGEGGGSEGIAHLLRLGSRLGTFFPSAVGPGPIPGVEQLLQEASDAVSTVERYPPTPGYKYAGLAVPAIRATGSGDGSGGVGGGMSEIGMMGVRAVGSGGGGGGGGGDDDGFGARFLATPGLTPILPARTPDAAIGGYGGGGGGGGGPGEEEDTPSMFLSGLLRGSSPGTVGASVGAAAAAAAAAATDEGDAEGVSVRDSTPVHGDGRAMGAAGVRAARMAAAGYGVTGAGAGGGAGAGAGAGAGGYGAREAYTRGEAAGAGTGGGGGRVTRGAGGRRIGGRLSFSSALGADDGSGEEGAGGAGGEQEERARTGGGTTGVRVSGRRWVVGLGPAFDCFAFLFFRSAREREQRSVRLIYVCRCASIIVCIIL